MDRTDSRPSKVSIDRYFLETHLNRCMAKGCEFNSHQKRDREEGNMTFCTFKKVEIDENGKCSSMRNVQ